MSKFRVCSFIFVVLWLIPVISTAQVNDAGLWTTIQIEKSLTQKITVELSEELRFNENISELGTIQSELGLSYRFNKWIAVSLAYRFSQKRQLDDSYNKRHRFISNLNLRNSFGNLTVALRLRYQSQYVNVYSSDNGKVPNNYARTKLTFKYDLNKKYTPYISGETFYHMNNREGVLFNNYRIAGGIEYELNKKNEIDVGYLIDRELNINNPWTSYIIGVAWIYKF